MENQRIVESFGDHTYQLKWMLPGGLAVSKFPLLLRPLSSRLSSSPRPSKSEYLLIHPVIPPLIAPTSLQPSSSSRVCSIPLPSFITSLPFTASFHPLLSSFALSSTRSSYNSDLFRTLNTLTPSLTTSPKHNSTRAKPKLDKIVYLLSESSVLLAESYHIPISSSCSSNLRTPSVTHSKPSTSNELWDPRLVDEFAPKAALRCYNLQKNGILSIRKPRLLSCSLDATRNLGRLLVLGSSSRPIRH
ncbi:hypothetical protein ASPCAL13060 [Aspergillus calidoustus]|uniref:Uncharacterized protein n=1 Tax=Aspergillus calidoustus TaxID=454130 RepID=A0A0U5CGX6_ASPCI|nr:hypothetical protein ASPCAL13060 [Aspergillus calidoustus]